MPRDPEYRAVVGAAVARARARGAASGPSTVAQWRREYDEQMAGVPREPMAQVTDLRVAGLPARLYRPEQRRGGPCLVFLHGGGWALGGIGSYDPVARTLARTTGAAVLSVGYRLAPEHPFPAAVHDAYAATRWALDNGRTLGFDRVAVAGDSAGGNLAAVTALRLRDEGAGDGPALAAQVLIYPVVDLRAVPPFPPDPDGLTFDSPESAEVLHRYLAGADPAQPAASPLLAPDLGGLPPAVVVTVEYDKLRAQGEQYADRLRSAGVHTELLHLPGLDHGFLSWTGLAGQARRGSEEIGRRVRELLAR